MDYDVVKTSVQNAYKYFGHNDIKFYTAMSDFYKEGKKNPSVAKIMMQDNIRKSRETASQILNKVAAIPVSDYSSIMYPEVGEYQNKLYNLSLSAAMKSINASDIYEKSKDTKIDGVSDFKKVWSELYPRTGQKRERIIEANRVYMDSIKQKAGWLEKISYAKTIAEYKKDYPKTFYVRNMLITNEQINEDGVTSRVKNWFKRFSYKRLIKDGFCFKK